MLKCEKLALKAVFSRSLKSAQDTASLNTQENAQPDLYATDAGEGKSYEDLLKREDIAAVIIALPIMSQGEYIESALKAGKHVLAEKPIAADVARGQKLIESYRKISADNGATLAIAENFRFKPSLIYAAEEAKKFGKVTHFSARILSLMSDSTKWYKTEWRRKPEYQGGFLLDGGVHFAAATRLFLAGDSRAVSTQASTFQAQEHLPPIDTVNAVVKTQAGASGIYQQSAGSLCTAFQWDIGLQRGNVKVDGETVTVKPMGGQESVREFPRTSGVSEEVAAWAEGISAGEPNPLQSPEEALADLEFLEKMFRSGEQEGALQRYELQ